MTAAPASNDLTQGPIVRTLTMFALPILGSNVLQALNGSVNAMWVSRAVGEAGLTAVANANILMFLLFGVLFGLTNAATILIGQAVGAKDMDRARQALASSLTVFMSVVVAVSLAGWLFTPAVLEAMGTPGEARALADAYLRIVFLSLPITFAFVFIVFAQRAAGSSTPPFVFMAMSVALDFVFNPALIYGWGPLPALGIAGSALASLLATICSFIAMLIYLYRVRHPLRLRRGDGRHLKPSRSVLWWLLSKGAPIALESLIVSSSAIVLISLVNRFGVQTAAAYGATMQLWGYAQMPMFAVAGAVGAMAAQTVGAQRWERMPKITLAGLGLTAVMTGSAVVALYLADEALLRLFLPEGGETLRQALRIDDLVLPTYALLSFTIVLFSVTRATGAVVAPLLIFFTALWLARVPFAELMIPRLGADAIWLSFPLGATVSLIGASLYYRYGPWRARRPAVLGEAQPA